MTMPNPYLGLDITLIQCQTFQTHPGLVPMLQALSYGKIQLEAISLPELLIL